jgi:hypothetical protein
MQVYSMVFGGGGAACKCTTHDSYESLNYDDYVYFIIVLFVETPRNLRGVSTNKTIICFIAMQTYKELIMSTLSNTRPFYFV